MYANKRKSGEHLMHSYDVEANNLGELAEDSDEDTSGSGNKRTSFDDGPSRGGRRKESVKMGGKSFDRARR